MRGCTMEGPLSAVVNARPLLSTVVWLSAPISEAAGSLTVFFVAYLPVALPSLSCSCAEAKELKTELIVFFRSSGHNDPRSRSAIYWTHTRTQRLLHRNTKQFVSPSGCEPAGP